MSIRSIIKKIESIPLKTKEDLVNVRKALGLSQEKMAKALSTPYNSYTNWEKVK